MNAPFRNGIGRAAFWIALLVLAVVVQVALYNRVAAKESPQPLLARGTVAFSLVLWFGVGLAGRAIGFV